MCVWVGWGGGGGGLECEGPQCPANFKHCVKKGEIRFSFTFTC